MTFTGEALTEPAPPLVIVSGAPGSGKSTLASVLSHELRLPVIARDTLKEEIADALMPAERGGPAGVPADDSTAIGRAAYAILFAITDQLLDAGVGVIIESNFRRGLSEAELAPRAAKASAVLVHCEASHELILTRFVSRAGTVGRHRVHPDVDRLDEFGDELAAGRFEPLELGIETVRVDTSSGYRPTLPLILDEIRRVTEPD